MDPGDEFELESGTDISLGDSEIDAYDMEAMEALENEILKQSLRVQTHAPPQNIPEMMEVSVLVRGADGSYAELQFPLYADATQEYGFLDFSLIDNIRDAIIAQRYIGPLGGSDELFRDILDEEDFQISRIAIAPIFGGAGMSDNIEAFRDVAPYDERMGFNMFDMTLLTSRFTGFNTDLSALSGQGLCVLEVLEWIRNDGYKGQRFSRETVALKNEVAMQFVRDNFTESEVKAIYQGNIFKSMLAYKRVVPEMDFGFYDIHSDQVVELEYSQQREAHVVKGSSLDVEYDLLCERLSGEGVNNVQEQEHILSQSVFAHKWWIIYERMHVSPLSQEEMKEIYAELRLKRTVEFDISRGLAYREHSAVQKKAKKQGEDCNAGSNVFALNKGITAEFIAKKIKEALKRYSGEATPAQVASATEKVHGIYQFGLVEGTPQMEVAKEQVRNKIAKVGVATLDFETVIDNSADELIGNVRPVVLCVYGWLYQDIFVKEKVHLLTGLQQEEFLAKNKPWQGRVGRLFVDKVFEGYDCAEQFVQWLMTEGIIAQAVFSVNQSAKGKTSKKHNYLKQYKNIFVAHNGAKFDFRFLLDVLTKYSNPEVVGTLQQMKKLSFKNIQFVDSCQLLPFSLASLGKSLKTTARKFPYDLENVTAETWSSPALKESLIKYCSMDCKALYEIYMTYITKRATTYFGGRSFPKNIFPATSSQGALDILQNCFLGVSLKAYPEIVAYERESYIGGLCVPFGTAIRFGISADINSSYPAAMHNILPTVPQLAKAIEDYVRVEDQYVNVFDGVTVNVISSLANPKWYEQCREHLFEVEQIEEKYLGWFLWEELDDLSLYYVDFSFPASVKYPSLVMKQSEDLTLLMPLSSGHTGQWIWGCELNFAVKEQGAHIKIYKYISYKGEPVFKEFIESLYEMRLAAKKNHDDVLSLLLKLIMNSSYGKLGQKVQPVSMYGHMQLIQDTLVQYRRAGKVVTVLSIKPILSANDVLFELKYTVEGDEYSQIGMMVKLAAYITALSRLNLCRGMMQLAALADKYYLERGIEESPDEGCHVKYIDTDSIYMSLEHSFSEAQQRKLLQLQEDHKEGSRVKDRFMRAAALVKKFVIQRKEGLIMEEQLEERVVAMECAFYLVKLVEEIVVVHYHSAKVAINLISYLDDVGGGVATSVAPSWASLDDLLYQVKRAKQVFKRRIMEEYLQEQVIAKVKAVYDDNELYSRICAMEIQDGRAIHDSTARVPFLDATVCGAYKIEKRPTYGIFLGAKQYCVEGFDEELNGEYNVVCKMKGIQAKHRQMAHYKSMYSKLDFTKSQDEIISIVESEVVPAELKEKFLPVQQYKQTQFRVLATGVHIAELYKYIQPTLTKRKFLAPYGHASLPFSNPVEWKANKIQCVAFSERLKEVYKRNFAVDDIVNQVKSMEFFSAQKDLIQKEKIQIKTVFMDGHLETSKYSSRSDTWEVQDEFSRFDNTYAWQSERERTAVRNIVATFIPAENVKGRFAVASPLIFNKLNFKRQLEVICQQKPAEFIEMLLSCFMLSADYYLQRYAGVIKKCNMVENVKKAVIRSKFLHLVLQRLYAEFQKYVGYPLASPYEVVFNLCEAKVQQCLEAEKWVQMNYDLVDVVNVDYTAVMRQTKELICEMDDDMLKSKFNDIVLLDEQVTSLKRNALGDRMESRLVQFRNGIHESTKKRVAKAHEKVVQKLRALPKRYRPHDDSVRFPEIVAEFERLKTNQRLYYLKTIVDARVGLTSSPNVKYETLIQLIRVHVMFDDSVFETSNRALSAQRLTSLKKEVRQFLDKIYEVYFAGTFVTDHNWAKYLVEQKLIDEQLCACLDALANEEEEEEEEQ